MNEERISKGERVFRIIALSSNKSGIREFSYDSVIIAFYELAKKFPEQFSGMKFQVLSGGSPYSRCLEDIIFRSGTWGGMYFSGRGMKNIEVTERSLYNLERDIEERYGKIALEELKNMADEFIQSITAPIN